MESHEHLSRGFNWLGGATVIARIIDFGTILVVLLFLTRQQLGVASLVVSTGMVIEALNGLGTNEALIQARSISRVQLDTLFWFVLGAGVCTACLTMLAAPLLQAIYGAAGMTTYFVAIALKQPVVGAALIPLAIMNRELRYERIALVNVCATLAAAATRLGLAVSGAGSWALVAGYSASGLYVLIGASLARPFRPAFRFQIAAIAPLLRYGWRAAASGMFEQTFKNVDYLLVGWFYGTAQLAVYRVAFDIAMEPAMAVGTLVNRTALPVFARVAAAEGQLARSLQWSLRRLVILTAPLMVGLILAAAPLADLLHDGRGNSYAAAALPLKILAAAALPRIVSQLLSPVLMASGRPGLAAQLSAVTLLLLTTGILAAGLLFHAPGGLVAVAVVWLAVYPLLLVWGVRYLRRHWNIAAWELARCLIAPLAGTALMAIAATVPLAIVGGGDPRLRIGVILALTLATTAGLLLVTRRRRRQP